MTVATSTNIRPPAAAQPPARFTRRPFADIGHADHGWLKASHHFSFGGYHDPAHMGWGALRVWNDDEIGAKSGFPPHPHRDMEIITYVFKGAISHRDSLGNEGRTPAGEVQVMSAGHGITHAEYNLEDETTRLFQIWVMPRKGGIPPRWEMRDFPGSDRSGLTVLASGYGDDGALPIEADARLLAGTLAAGTSVTIDIDAGRHGYAVAARGAYAIDGERFEARDGLRFRGGASLTLDILEETELVLVDSI